MSSLFHPAECAASTPLACAAAARASPPRVSILSKSKLPLHKKGPGANQQRNWDCFIHTQRATPAPIVAPAVAPAAAVAAAAVAAAASSLADDLGAHQIIAGKHIKTMQKMLRAKCCACICRLLQCHVAQLLIFRWVK